MTFGYWFWLGVACLAAAVGLYALTARHGHRAKRTVHTITLFVLLAFGGFKCAYEEASRKHLLDSSPGVYVVGIARSDGGGLRKDGKYVEGLEYTFGFGGRGYTAFGLLRDAYTIERDFTPEELSERCMLVKTYPARPDVSRIAALLKRCVASPEDGWDSLPLSLAEDIDTLWWRGMGAEGE